MTLVDDREVERAVSTPESGRKVLHLVFSDAVTCRIGIPLIQALEAIARSMLCTQHVAIPRGKRPTAARQAPRNDPLIPSS
jgi:hypothetical protein